VEPLPGSFNGLGLHDLPLCQLSRPLGCFPKAIRRPSALQPALDRTIYGQHGWKPSSKPLDPLLVTWSDDRSAATTVVMQFLDACSSCRRQGAEDGELQAALRLATDCKPGPAVTEPPLHPHARHSEGALGGAARGRRPGRRASWKTTPHHSLALGFKTADDFFINNHVRGVGTAILWNHPCSNPSSMVGEQTARPRTQACEWMAPVSAHRIALSLRESAVRGPITSSHCRLLKNGTCTWPHAFQQLLSLAGFALLRVCAHGDLSRPPPVFNHTCLGRGVVDRHKA